MDERDLLTLQSAVTAIEEAASAVAREVERDRLRESSLAASPLSKPNSTGAGSRWRKSSRKRQHKAFQHAPTSGCRFSAFQPRVHVSLRTWIRRECPLRSVATKPERVDML